MSSAVAVNAACSRVLVYGGKGALGAAVVKHFKAKKAWVLNVDLANNEEADANVIVDPTWGWTEQEAKVDQGVKSHLSAEKLDAILCVAGGWNGGNAASAEFIKNSDLVWKQSVWSSAISARLASRFLKPRGLLQLTGAAAAQGGTPGMIGYGMAKAAVHQMVKSLGDWHAAGLPEETTVVGILPVTLDTPMNRKWMPKADFSSWTPLEFIAQHLYKWTNLEEPRPNSGTLLTMVTKNGETVVDKA